MRFVPFPCTDRRTIADRQRVSAKITVVFLMQMEDPNLLEESSALIEGNEAGRGAPLRLG